MSRTIFIEKKAIREIKQANEWYFEKSVLASENFGKEVYEMFQLLKDKRVEHRKIVNSIHVLPMKIFPYNIYYVFDNLNVKVIAFLHTKRNPDFIEKRLR
jgi:plasmid stabilization system protein ParE